MQGYRIKLPVQLGRREQEKSDQEIMEFYLNLINVIPRKKLTLGNWSLCRVDSVGDFSNTNLIAHIWTAGEDRLLTVINYSPYNAKGHVIIENMDYGTVDWNFTDLLAQEIFVYDGENLSTHGLYVELQAWKCHIFEVKKDD
jgi:hypothetical protein